MSLSQQTPNNMDGLSHLMAEAFDEKQVISVPSGFQAFFGNPAGNGKTLFSPDAVAVDIDIIRGNERTAALIQRGSSANSVSGSKRLNVGKMTNFSRKFPLAEVEGIITADQLLYRQPGETPAASMTRVDRMRGRALTIHQESVRQIARTFERLAAQAMLTGAHDAVLGTSNTDLQYDFLRKSTHTIATIEEWDDEGNPLEQIDAAWDLVREDAHISADFLGIGQGAFNALIKNSHFAAYADKFKQAFVNFANGVIVPPRFQRFIEAGWTCRGMLTTPGGHEIWVFNYTEVYQDEAGDFQKYLPSASAILTSSAARFDRYFGPGETLPLVAGRQQLYMELFGIDISQAQLPPNVKGAGLIVDPRAFYCDAYLGENSKSVIVRSQAAPIFATTHTDGIVVMNDLLQ